jgi:hypothetical protein
VATAAVLPRVSRSAPTFPRRGFLFGRPRPEPF